MNNEYKNDAIFNNQDINPFCTDFAIGVFGMISKLYRDTERLNKKISKNTYIRIEKIYQDN